MFHIDLLKGKNKYIDYLQEGPGRSGTVVVSTIGCITLYEHVYLKSASLNG